MKCMNCGAEVVGSVCEYCGTHYNGRQRIDASFDQECSCGVLTVGENEYSVYISRIEIRSLAMPLERDLRGRLKPQKTLHKRIFTLVER